MNSTVNYDEMIAGFDIKPVVKATRTWSVYQEDIFTFVENGKGNAVVQAVAGSGKTTTIVEALKKAQGSTIFLAFNKSIAEELKSRGVNARTFHSLTFNPVLRAKGASTVTNDKLRQIARERWNDDEFFGYSAFCIKLVGLARQVGIDCLIENVEENWYDLIEQHSLELANETQDMSRAVALARELLTASNHDTRIDFDDMLYLAVKDGIRLPTFDFVFVDEAQDTNAIQRAILRKIMARGVRIIAVGDAAQAIYGFRGADSGALDLIGQEFNCKTLPLSVTYRCGTQIVKYAQQFSKTIEAAPGAHAGEVINLGNQFKLTDFNQKDLIVCRTTKPLVSLCYQLISKKIPANVMGKDIGIGLTALIKKMNAAGIDKLVSKLEAYCAKETEKAVARGQEFKVEAISDKVDSILVMIEGLGEKERTIPKLIAVIESMFTDSKKNLTLATIHKSKGLEADKVWIINFNKRIFASKQEWQRQQETNLCYVAITRAKNTLVLIETK